MRDLVLSTISIAVLTLAACGGKKVPAAGGGSSTGSAAGPSGSNCCCELPSDPPTFKIEDSRKCHEDSHGTCKDDASCQGTAKTVP